ncbi:hypothetical protein BJX63DRAFT_434600 [Aspergillus granulosus]|uniref:Uncharacterized protein n=1 Tax=Aspergillus granulosus TaxID=176169 RepID=A0ABR4H3Q9_9EURO
MHPVVKQTSASKDHSQNQTEGIAEGQERQNPDVTVNSNTQAHEKLLLNHAAEVEPPQDSSTDAAASQSPGKQGRKAALKKDKRRRNPKWAPYFSTRKRQLRTVGTGATRDRGRGTAGSRGGGASASRDRRRKELNMNGSSTKPLRKRLKNFSRKNESPGNAQTLLSSYNPRVPQRIMSPGL